MSVIGKYAWVLSVILITQGCEITPAQWEGITAFCRAVQERPNPDHARTSSPHAESRGTT